MEQPDTGGISFWPAASYNTIFMSHWCVTYPFQHKLRVNAAFDLMTEY